MTSIIHDIRGAKNPLDRLGRPLHDLRISVMDRCNFRCPYCMPKEQFHEHYRFLKSQERLSFDEIVRLARLFASLGVRKLRLTGGEPLLRANLADLVGDLTGIPGIEDIALTTNGVLPQQHSIRRQRNVLDAWDVGEVADQIRQIRAQQRFAARETQFAHAQVREHPRETHDFLERQSLLRFQESIVFVKLLFRHAVRAAKVASVHDRDAQIVQRPAETVERVLRST